MNQLTQQNKKIVLQFNKEVIEEGNIESFNALVAKDCINHAAPQGTPDGPESMFHFIIQLLRPAFSGLKAVIHDQVAEGDKVTTRKSLHATHTGEFMGIPASGKKIVIEVIDIIRLQNGQYAEHWGISNLHSVIEVISAK